MAITPFIEPTPAPVTKKIYSICTHCNGTGKISLTMGDASPIESPCGWCNGAGKTVFGEVEV